MFTLKDVHFNLKIYTHVQNKVKNEEVFKSVIFKGDPGNQAVTSKETTPVSHFFSTQQENFTKDLLDPPQKTSTPSKQIPRSTMASAMREIFVVSEHLHIPLLF